MLVPIYDPSWWTKESISSALGVVSIVCWVVAQAPQFYENYTSQSCQGLALPFLVNWLAGDVTNLVGCVLTDQKEFQTWLAVYFCLIDFVLTGQYFYYTRPTTNRSSTSQTHGRDESRDEVEEDRVVTGDRSGSRSQRYHSRSSYRQESGEDQSLTEAALQVALAAERVERSRSRRRRGSGAGPGGTTTGEESGRTSLSGSRLGLNLGQAGQGRTKRGVMATTTTTTSFRSEDGPIDEDEDDAEGVLGDNVWDTSPGRAVRGGPSSSTSLSNSPSVTFQPGHLSTAGHLSTDRGRASRAGTNASVSPVLGLPRRSESRSASRPAGVNSGSPSTTTTTLRTGGRRGSSSTRRAPSGTAAGVVFMGVWVLAGVRWGSSGSSALTTTSRGSVNTGRVLSRRHAADNSPWTTTPDYQATRAEVISLSFDAKPSDAFPNDDHDDDSDHSEPHDHRRWDKPAVQRLIGRMSAWICTTLYLTSRLPQIWKNYQRKSVEGLSILLFVFAFCGNLTYVLSIVLNPTGSDGESNPEMTGYYLLEALPYLLGSGGTLVFDLTIMIQSLVYGSAPPIDERDQEDYIEPIEGRERRHRSHSHGHGHGHGRSRSSRRHSKRLGDEESRPLLSGGGDIEDGR